MRRPSLGATIAALVALIALPALSHATPRTLEDYRYFRALAIDLEGRIPTSAEIAAFEQPSFDVATWIDARLAEPAYADRMVRVYNDRMRLEMIDNTGLQSTTIEMRRIQVQDAAGHPQWVYFRPGQRRTNVDTDGVFCFTPAETGVQLPSLGNTPTPGCDTPRNLTQALLDQRTVLVRPWWLYSDYRAASPTHAYDPATWAASHPGYVPTPGLLTNPDGTPMGAAPMIRVCREEAQPGATGAVYAPGPRTRTVTTGCGAQTRPAPADSAYARTNVGMMVDCASSVGLASSAACGCGVGLERCLPGTNNAMVSSSFVAPVRPSMSDALALDAVSISQEAWIHRAWTQEAEHFLADIFGNDRDVRNVLQSRDTFVNGPLAQFYRTTSAVDCCGAAGGFPGNMPFQSHPLFEPANVPAALLPHDVATWTHVADRGPLASGLITMPIFLSKFGTRRARAHVLYNTFLCKDFVAGNLMLTADSNPNLTERNGCAVCHASLEPLAAYFTRVQESTWVYLPEENFPLHQASCPSTLTGGNATACGRFYDPNFATTGYGMLLGSYASQANANAGVAGIAAHLVAAPEFAPCVAQNIAESFLGRPLGADDAPLQASLATTLTSSSYRVRAVVRALLLSDAYRHSNDLSSSAWRTTTGEH